MIDHVESAIRQVMGVIVKILGIALLITVVIQVVSRYFPVTMVWTDELSRFLFVWFSMLAIALAYMENKHLSMDFVYEKLPRSVQKALDFLSELLVFLAACVIVVEGFGLLKTVAIQKAPILRIGMNWFYMAVPVGFTFVAAHALLLIIRRVAGWFKKDGGKESSHGL